MTTSFDDTKSAVFIVFRKVLVRVSRRSWLPDVGARTELSLLCSEGGGKYLFGSMLISDGFSTKVRPFSTRPCFSESLLALAFLQRT